MVRVSVGMVLFVRVIKIMQTSFSHSFENHKEMFSHFFCGVSVAISALFFFSKWAINSDSLGKFNLGYALLFSFVSSILLYVSVGLALLSFLAGAYSFIKSGPKRVYVIAMVCALLPICYFVFLLK